MKKLGVVSVLVFLIMFLGVSLLATVDMSAEGELTSSDFSGLSYTDKKGDDYTFRWEGDVSGFKVEYEDSWGKKGENPYCDILKLEATLSDDNVIATMECAGNIQLGYDMDYMIFFVNSNHDPRNHHKFEPLINPKDYKESSISVEYMDTSNTIIHFGYDSVLSESSARASDYFTHVDGKVSGKKMTITVLADDLEYAGVSPNSGFDIYGFVMKVEVGRDFYQYTWDSIGCGAVPAPDEFDSREVDPVAGAVCLLLIIAGIIIIVVIIFYFAKKKKEKDIQALQQYQQRQKQYLQQQKQYLQQQQQYQQSQQQYQQPQQQYQQYQQQYQHPQTYQPPQQQYQQYSQQPAYQQTSSAATQSTQYPCSYCRQPMTYNDQYQRWYCDYCRRYA